MALGKRLEYARKLRGMTQEQLAKEAFLPSGSGQATIQALERRDSKRTQYAWQLAKALRVRLEWLTDGQEPMDEPRNPRVPETDSNGAIPQRPHIENSGGSGIDLMQVEVWDDDTPLDDETVEIVLYKTLEVASGSGVSQQLIFDEGHRLRFGRRTLSKAGVDAVNSAGGVNCGNSNEPVIPDGAIVMIDRSKTKIVAGDLYGIDHEGEFRAKLLYPLPGGGLRVRSYNREEWPDEDYGADWHSKIKVLGWVWTWAPPIRKWRG